MTPGRTAQLCCAGTCPGAQPLPQLDQVSRPQSQHFVNVRAQQRGRRVSAQPPTPVWTEMCASHPRLWGRRGGQGRAELSEPGTRTPLQSSARPGHLRTCFAP